MLFTKWIKTSWFVLQWEALEVSEFVADVSCFLSFLPSDSSWKPELLLESFPARADSGLEAALLPVSSLRDCAALTQQHTQLAALLVHIEPSGQKKRKVLIHTAAKIMIQIQTVSLKMKHFYLALFSCKKYLKKEEKKPQASKNHMYST